MLAVRVHDQCVRESLPQRLFEAVEDGRPLTAIVLAYQHFEAGVALRQVFERFCFGPSTTSPRCLSRFSPVLTEPELSSVSRVMSDCRTHGLRVVECFFR